MKRYEFMDEYWEDNDGQDGSYYREPGRACQPSMDPKDCAALLLEEKKWRAVLYLHAHPSLLKNALYRKVYDMILGKRTAEDDPEVEDLFLNTEIDELGAQEIQHYKQDAEEIAAMVAEGKSLTAYFELFT